MFLVEPLTLSLGGGLVGVGLGLGSAYAVSSLANWRILIQPQGVLLAVGVAMAVGIVFGVYPARKAARLTPIDALRFE